jgi:hypothetical protein
MADELKSRETTPRKATVTRVIFGDLFQDALLDNDT